MANPNPLSNEEAVRQHLKGRHKTPEAPLASMHEDSLIHEHMRQHARWDLPHSHHPDSPLLRYAPAAKT